MFSPETTSKSSPLLGAAARLIAGLFKSKIWDLQVLNYVAQRRLLSVFEVSFVYYQGVKDQTYFLTDQDAPRCADNYFPRKRLYTRLLR